MKKERLHEFDVLRGLAFIFIVIQHTIGGFSFRDDIMTHELFISKLLYTIAEIGVTLFLFLTAIGLLYTYYDKFDIKDFYIKKFKYLLFPLAFWSIIILINNGQPINFSSIFIILTGSAQYHLWYMGMILRIYLYFPLILVLARYIGKKSFYFKCFCFLLLAFLYIKILNNYQILDIAKNFLFKNPTEVQEKFVNITPLFYYFYFVIGAYVILNYKKFKEIILKYKYIVIILYAISLSYSFYLNLSDRIGNPLPFIRSSQLISVWNRSISILFFYLVSYYIASKLKYVFTVVNFVGRYSFPAYLIHVLVLNKLTYYLSITAHLSSYLRYFFFTISITLFICFILNYLPFTHCITGMKSRFSIEKIKDNLKKLSTFFGYLHKSKKYN